MSKNTCVSYVLRILAPKRAELAQARNGKGLRMSKGLYSDMQRQQAVKLAPPEPHPRIIPGHSTPQLQRE